MFVFFGIFAVVFCSMGCAACSGLPVCMLGGGEKSRLWISPATSGAFAKFAESADPNHSAIMDKSILSHQVNYLVRFDKDYKP